MSLSELSGQPGKVESIVQQLPYVAEPLARFGQLSHNSPASLLLESAEISSKDHLKSLMLIDACLRLECRGQQVACEALSDNGKAVLEVLASALAPQIAQQNTDSLILHFTRASDQLDEDSRLKADSVFNALRQIIQQITPIRDNPNAVFLGGVFAYDLLASYEALPDVAEGPNDCPDFVFYVAETLILIDHTQQTSELIGSVFSGAQVATEYFRISQRMETLRKQLDLPVEPVTNSENASRDVACNKDDDAFCRDVLALKEHILAGDIFQVVPSRTFSLPCPAPLAAYAKLKALNPSPYMFYMQDAAFQLFGASPESALKYDKDANQVEVYPIAGTRRRGFNAAGQIDRDLDSRIELELREDGKEKAEHLMLVDLARNDLARVCEPGSRYVKDLLQVDRYSQVMHLVSRVVGQLRSDLDPLHAYTACMNMGTLVGAPKVSAARLIREVEQCRRGSYGGAVGYLNSHGDMDTCIVIRSAFVKQGIAYIQAGAGVVYDSNPQSEADETRNKAQAVIRAIQLANGGQ